MCGIVAMISKKEFGFQYKDKQMFRQMLYANALRGEDSTGVFGVNKYGNLKMVKAATPAATFQTTKTYDDFESDIYKDFRIVVGHNRAATKGAKIDDNAHPFIEGNTCLIHNGTLWNHKNLADTDVDSHAICKAIDARGYVEALPDVHGAFALIWYDAKQKRLYITRNKERPLWLIDTDDAIYMASEPTMLQWIYARVYGKKENAAYFKEDQIYYWDLGQKEKIFTIEDFPVKKVKPILTTVPVKQELAKTSQQTGTISFTKLQERYKVGDRIVFEHVSNSIVGNKATISGITYDDSRHSVKSILDISSMSHDEIVDLFDDSEFLTGTIRGYSVPKGKITLFVDDVRIEQTYTTILGECVLEQELASVGYTCNDCGTIVDPDDEDGLFWVRKKAGSIKKLLCSHCAADHPHLSKEMSKCTKELLSSHMSRVANPLKNYEDLSHYSLNNLC